MEPLTVGQKLFNQRLLAEHCLPEDRARELWAEIAAELPGGGTSDHDDPETGMGGATFEESVAGCNEQLKHCGLAIRCVAVRQAPPAAPRRPQNSGDDHDDDGNDGSDSGAGAGAAPGPGPSSAGAASARLVKHYAIVDVCPPDDVARGSLLASLAPGEANFARIVLRALVEEADAADGTLPRADLVNLRSRLDGDRETLTLPAAEAALDRLLAAKWVEYASTRRGNRAPVRLAPRTYMELGHLLTEEFGMEKEDLPQIIYL